MTGAAADELAWRGHLDMARRDWVEGWAQDISEPERRVMLRILDNGVTIAEVCADRFRHDLLAAGVGDGCHAFSHGVPGGLAPDVRHIIEVRRLDDARLLHGSPLIVEPARRDAPLMRNAAAAPWTGYLETVTRERIEGWAWDERAPGVPLALVILDNGEVIGRVLANRYRRDLQDRGMGDGRLGFALRLPHALSPLETHVIQVLGEADGCEMPSSPAVIGAADGFDGALERFVEQAVGGIVEPSARGRALSFMAAQVERLLQQQADADAGREERLMLRQWRHRWGVASAVPAAPVPEAPARKRALVIDEHVPAADRDAGSQAVLSHMRGLQRLGFEVSFAAAASVPPAGAAAALAALGVHVCGRPYYASVEEVLRRQTGCFDLIYLHRISNAERYLALARAHSARGTILYSVADLHHVRVERQARIEQRPELLALSRRLRLAECVAAGAASAVLTHSIAEAAWLRDAVRGCAVHVAPWEVPLAPVERPWRERHGVAFIGSFAHAPNADAARALCTRIMPLVWQADPSIGCLLAGSGMTEAIRRLAGPRIEVVGQVPRLSAVFERVRLTAAPLRFGAGVKGKVLESFAAGLPCVMSPVAAEGLALPDVLAGAVGADFETFAAKIVHLHNDETAARACAEAGMQLIATGHTEAVVVAALRAAIESRGADGLRGHLT